MSVQLHFAGVSRNLPETKTIFQKPQLFAKYYSVKLALNKMFILLRKKYFKSW